MIKTKKQARKYKNFKKKSIEKQVYGTKSMKNKTTPSYGEWYHLLGHHLVDTSMIMKEIRWE